MSRSPGVASLTLIGRSPTVRCRSCRHQKHLRRQQLQRRQVGEREGHGHCACSSDQRPRRLLVRSARGMAAGDVAEDHRRSELMPPADRGRPRRSPCPCQPHKGPGSAHHPCPAPARSHRSSAPAKMPKLPGPPSPRRSGRARSGPRKGSAYSSPSPPTAILGRATAAERQVQALAACRFWSATVRSSPSRSIPQLPANSAMLRPTLM